VLAALYNILPQWAAHTSLSHGRLAVTWTERGNHRRWLPDAVTALLLLRLQPGPPSTPIPVQTERQHYRAINSAMERALSGYFRSASQIREQRPANLSEFLDAALFDLELRLPRALAQYAASKQVSHSLRPKAWRRLMGEPPIKDERPPARDREAFMTGEPANDELPSNDEESEQEGDFDTWLKDLRNMLNPDSKKGKEKGDALKELDKYLKKPSSSVSRIFVGYAQWLLKQHAKSRKGNTLKSLRTQIIAVATRLPGLVRFHDPASLNGDTLQAAYQQILEDASSDNQRQKLSGYLRSFHHHLVDIYRVEKIDEGETFIYENDVTVDANLILEDEYQKALIYLEKGQVVKGRPADKRLRKLARLILILGYRCGLRRMEVLKLQLTDFNEHDPAELLVRPWEQRRLKTPNATRKMPLYALLDENELELLRNWKIERQKESKENRKRRPSPFLFSIPSMEYDFLPEELVFPLIHEALRVATGDPTLHFHHLRHSFASWITFALMRPPDAPLPQWLADLPQNHWPQMHDWISRSSELHKALYGNEFLTRRHLFAVSRLLGHSGPEMSLEHYVHVADQLLALWLEKQMPRFEPALWIAASGLPLKTVYRRLRIDPKSGFWKLVERRAHEVLGKGKNATKVLSAGNKVTAGSSSEPEPQQEVALSIINNLWLVLYLHAEEGLSAKDLGPRFGFSEALVEQLIAVAEEVEKQRSNKKTFRHHLATDRRDNRIACPRKPREKEEWNVIDRFAAKLWNLLRTKPYLCGAILNHYLKSPRSERNGLEFRKEQKKMAQQYLYFLGKLGVQQDELLRLRFAAKDSYELFWGKLLRLQGDDDESVKPAKPPAPEKARRNDIGIKVVFALTDSAKGVSNKASYGMHYLLVMAGIWIEARLREESASSGPSEQNQRPD